MSKITRFNKGFDNSALRCPYINAVLDCGHYSTVQMLPGLLECQQCGARHEQHASGFTCGCGCRIGTLVFWPEPHNDEHRISRLGDTVECGECDAQRICIDDIRAAIATGNISHSRAREWCGRTIIYVYRYDSQSPSGFSLAASAEETPEVLELLRGSLSPLSPTEPR